MRRLLLLLLAFSVLAPAAATAREPWALVRFYYSQWHAGEVQASPLDPTGAYADEPLSSRAKGDLEVILLRRVGLSYTRQKLARGFLDTAGLTSGCATPPCAVEESAVQTAGNLTLYALPSRHFGFNLFLGLGRGQADYEFKVDGVRQDVPELHQDIPLRRTFGGIEYTFERIGFRLEVIRSTAERTKNGHTVTFKQDLRYFTVYIPFN